MIRENDVVARIGGEEYAILVSRIDHKLLNNLAERMRRAGADVFVDFKDATIRPTLSVGAVLSTDHDNADQKLVAADRYLYRAKELGRNRVVTKPDLEDEKVEFTRHAYGDNRMPSMEPIPSEARIRV